MSGCSSAGKHTKAEGVAAEKAFSSSETAAPANRDDAATVLVNTVVEHVHKLPNKRLTVTEFTDIDGKESEIGKLNSEKVTTKLSQVKAIKVIERKQFHFIATPVRAYKEILRRKRREIGRRTEAGQKPLQ